MLAKESVSSYLLNREINPCPSLELYRTRQLYRTIVPNKTLYNIDRPYVIPKKFTPDGKHLICISRNQRDVEVYYYHSMKASRKYSKWYNAQKPESSESQSEGPSLDFDHFFSLRHMIKVAKESELVCKDFCLFTEDRQYFIMASAMPTAARLASETAHEHASGTGNPSSLNYIRSLDDVTFHVIHIESGKIVFTKKFMADYMYLSYQSSVSLFGPYIAFTSIQQQTIEIYYIKSNGHFLHMNTIGAFLYPEDRYMLGAFDSSHHRFMAYVYRAIFSSDHKNKELFQLYANYNTLSNLILWKCQFLDAEHLLIKMGCRDYILSRSENAPGELKSNNNLSFLLVYHIPSTQVISVINNAFEEFMQVYINYADFFRPFYYARTRAMPYVSTPANNEFERASALNKFQGIKNNKSGGMDEAPYFDPNFFIYDDKVISPYDRPKSLFEFPIKFYSREQHALAFKFHSGFPPNHPQNSVKNKKVMAVVVHPFDPLIISLQSAPFRPIINIHYRI